MSGMYLCVLYVFGCMYVCLCVSNMCVCVCVCVCVYVCVCVHLSCYVFMLFVFIEYVGTVPPELRDSLLSDLNQQTAKLIQVVARDKGQGGGGGGGG